jgi:integrase/recombinase XerD
MGKHLNQEYYLLYIRFALFLAFARMRWLFMFEQLIIKKSSVIQRLQSSKFKSLLDKYAEYLFSKKYSKGSIGHYQRAAEHFFYWLESKKLTLPLRIDEPLIQKFLNQHIPVCKCPMPAPRDRDDLRAALRLLIRVQPIEFQTKVPNDKISVVLEEFNNHLIDVCGLTKSTCLYHKRHIKIFLKHFFKSNSLSWDRLNPQNIRDFLYNNLQQYKGKTLSLFVYSLRTFFKFLQFRGIENTSSLIAALPQAYNYKHDPLPEYLDKEEVSKLIKTFDLTTALGKRDYAIITCILELGLRGHEVANLRLDDINWREQTLQLPRGKTRQSYVLPMTTKFMGSLVKYLRYGRPQTTSRQIFVYHRAPVGEGIISKTVTETVRRAFVRAKLTSTKSGSHILRKTFATHLLQKGATIKEIADLLRHKSIETTILYTKVNFPQLAQVALPWPEELL